MAAPSWQNIPKTSRRDSTVNVRRWGYGLGGTLILLGFLVLAVAAGDTLRRATRGTHRLTLPGSRTVSLRPGIHVGLPGPGKTNSPRPGLNVTVQETLTGLSVPVLASPLIPAGAAAPLFQFEILDAGDYLVTGVTGPGAPAGGFDVVLVHESLASSRSDLAAGLVACLLLTAGGIYMMWAVRRRTRPTAEAGGPGTSAPPAP